jgi:nucleoside 2-deoxyribosyltransferase
MDEDRMSKFESGYFTAAKIPVPRDICDERGLPHFQQVNPHASFCQVTEDNGTTWAIDFIGNADGALLLVAMPDETFVRILMPVDTDPATYAYRAYFYGQNSNVVAYQHDGVFAVELGPKEDCGCRTLGTIQQAGLEAADERLAICADCPFNIDGVCAECGCVLEHKVRAGHDSCPIGKWGPVDA